MVLRIIGVESAAVRERLAEELTNSTDSAATFITTWTTDHLAYAYSLSQLPEVVELASILSDDPDDRSAALRLEEMLGPLTSTGLSHRGFILADHFGTPLAWSLRDDLDWDGEPVHYAPDNPVPLPMMTAADPEAGGIGFLRVWLAVGPLEQEEPVWIGIEVDPAPVTEFLGSTLGNSQSRELYMFSAEGELATPSRFEDDLRSIGLLGPGESSVGLRLSDPGADLTTGTHQLPSDESPLTEMAASAIRGQSGSNVEGYRDYRGVTVIGAWRWIGALDIGIATEIDHAEAFASLETTARRWILVAGGLTLLVVALTAVSIVTARRLERTGRALEALTADLEHEVFDRTRDLIASQESLRAASIAKDNLIAAVSHELRTPLAAIIGFSSIINETEDLDPAVRDLVTLILQEGTEMADIVDDLLTATRAMTGSLTLATESFDLAAEAAGVVSRWNPSEARRITFESNTPAPAVGDPGRIRQILRNLITNAMRHGGPSIIVAARQSDGQAVVAVADDGAPIPETTRDNMFDLYFRGDSGSSLAPSLGIGLGLSIRLAEAMGGTMTFKRRNGRNVFEVRVPAAELVTSAAPRTSGNEEQ